MARLRSQVRWWCLAGLLAAASSFWLSPLAQCGGASGPYSEESVKAAFLYRFASYVVWPEAPGTASTFNIAVLGANDVATRLEAMVADKSLQNRPVQVRRIATIQEAGTAQIVYIGAEHRADLRTLLKSLAGRNILAVTNEEQALDAGSTINLLTIDGRVRFEISVDAARRAGLKVGSELLSVATRVQGARLRADAGCGNKCPPRVHG